MTAVPPEAVAATSRAVAAYEPEATMAVAASPKQLLSVLLEAANRAVSAAAPLIQADAFTDGFIDGVATEKKNIIQLAVDHDAIYDEDPAAVGPHYAPFADLIAGGSQ